MDRKSPCSEVDLQILCFFFCIVTCACGSLPGIYRSFSQSGGCIRIKRSPIYFYLIKVHIQIMLFWFINCSCFDCCFLECSGSCFRKGERNMPLIIMIAYNSDIFDSITINHMLSFISCSLDPNLELTLCIDNFLGCCQINACKVNLNIIFSHSSNRNIFQAKCVEFIIKYISCKISCLSADSFFVS